MDFPEISHLKLQRETVKHFERLSQLMIPNCYPHNWFENDVLRVSKSGYWYEYEIKTSAADYNQDFKKRSAGIWIERDGLFIGRSKHRLLAEADLAGPSYFSFVFPIGLVQLKDVPDYCGVYEVCRYEGNGHFWLNEARKPPRLHKQKLSDKAIHQLQRNVCSRFLKGWLKENR